VKTATRGYDLFLSAVHTGEDLKKTIDAFGASLDALLEEKKL
jgi:hypothetical protein